MLAVKLFGYFEELEKISSRLAMLDILARMYGELASEEADKATYLLFGNLGPSYRSLEFNMAEKMVMRVMGKAYGISVEFVADKFKNLGDLGLVIGELKVGGRELSENINEIYVELFKLADLRGEGSQDKKIDQLASILSRANSVSAKYLIRIVLGKLRLGVGEMTVLDSFSWLICGDKSLHDLFENSYNIAADVGMLARNVLEVRDKNKLVWLENVRGNMEKAEAKIGVPIVMALCTRVATFDEVIVKLGEVMCEPKFDGNRVQIHFRRNKDKSEIVTFSRNLEESTYMFPELDRIGEWVDLDEAIFDCEAMGIDPVSGDWTTFQVTMTRKRKHGIKAQLESVPLKFMVFDLLYARGKKAKEFGANGDIHDWSLERRREILEEVIINNDLLEVTPVVRSRDAGKLRDLHNKYLEQGYEGAVIKQVNSPYVPGRKKGYWVKMKEVESADAKLPDTVDCVVMGYYRGEGRRGKFGIGSLLLGVRGKWVMDVDELNGSLFENVNQEDRYWTVTKVGSKLSDDQLKVIRKRLDELAVDGKDDLYEVPDALVPDVWVRPEMVVEVAGDNLTKSPLHSAKMALRFPRVIKIRDDKGAEQITSMEELWELYKMQKG